VSFKETYTVGTFKCSKLGTAFTTDL